MIADSPTPRPHPRPARRRPALLLLLTVLHFLPARADTLDLIRSRGELRWGVDAEGGAPFAFPDPAEPDKTIGFEVEIAAEIARRMGIAQHPVQSPWGEMLQSL